MIIRITNKCTMGCSHCMIDASSPDGEHMTVDIFDQTLDFAEKLGVVALLLSGGEPFEHPDVLEMIERSKNRFTTLVCSNGLFALDPEVRQRVILSGAMVQVTNDPRFYSRNLDIAREIYNQPHWSFENQIRIIFPCRRTREAGIEPTRQSPACFNLRSIARSHGLVQGLTLLQAMGKLCSPSVNTDGSIIAGEADTCHRIGDVYSTAGDIEIALREMRCNNCGLQNNLKPEYLEAIGECDARP